MATGCLWLIALFVFLGFDFGRVFGGIVTILLICVIALLVFIADSVNGQVRTRR